MSMGEQGLKFPFLRDNTCLFEYQNLLYKIRVRYDQESFKGRKVLFTIQDLSSDIEQTLRAVMFMFENRIKLQPIETEFFLILPYISKWSFPSKYPNYAFKRNDRVIEMSDYMFELRVQHVDVLKVEDNIDSPSVDREPNDNDTSQREGGSCSNKVVNDKHISLRSSRFLRDGHGRLRRQVNDQNDQDQNISVQGKESNQNNTVQGKQSTQNRSVQGKQSTQNRSVQGNQSNQNRSVQGNQSNQNRNVQRKPSNQNISVQGKPSNQNISVQGKPSNQNRIVQGKLSNQNINLQGKPSNQNKSVQGKPSHQSDSQLLEKERVPVKPTRGKTLDISKGKNQIPIKSSRDISCTQTQQKMSRNDKDCAECLEEHMYRRRSSRLKQATPDRNNSNLSNMKMMELHGENENNHTLRTINTRKRDAAVLQRTSSLDKNIDHEPKRSKTDSVSPVSVYRDILQKRNNDRHKVQQLENKETTKLGELYEVTPRRSERNASKQEGRLSGLWNFVGSFFTPKK